MPTEKELLKGLKFPGIEWIVSPAQLEALDPVQPRVVDGSKLVAEVGADGHRFGVTVLALPPEKTGVSKFWSRISSRLGHKDAPLPPTQLKIRPPIEIDEFVRAEHAPLSAVHPYVVVENGTRYAIGIETPNALMNTWSEEKSRRVSDTSSPYWLYGEEFYQELRSVGAAIRINGDTPITKLTIGGLLVPGVRELCYTFQPDEGTAEDGTSYDIFSKRSESVRTKPDQEEHPTDEYDMVFEVTGEQGGESNADFDTQNGKIQVIFFTCAIGERVNRIEYNPPQGRSDGGEIFDRNRYRSGGTLQGRTTWVNPKPTVKRIGNVENIEPLAEVNLVLVGQGGPITAEMTEAPALS